MLKADAVNESDGTSGAGLTAALMIHLIKSCKTSLSCRLLGSIIQIDTFLLSLKVPLSREGCGFGVRQIPSVR